MKKLSGYYLDNQGFRQTVYWHVQNKKYVKMINNSYGNFCSSQEYTKEQITHEIESFTRGFMYHGHLFTPIGNTVKGFVEKSLRLKREIINRENNWSYEEFWKEIKNNQIKRVDLYLMDGKTTVIPCSGALFEYE